VTSSLFCGTRRPTSYGWHYWPGSEGDGPMGGVKRALKYKPVSSFSASFRNFTLLPPKNYHPDFDAKGISQQSRIYCPEYPLPRILIARESINNIPLQRSGESAAGLGSFARYWRHLCCTGRNIATDVITRAIRSESVRLNSSQHPRKDIRRLLQSPVTAFSRNTRPYLSY
jgi:hypothetical protein